MKIFNHFLIAAATASVFAIAAPATAQTTYTNASGPVSIYINYLGTGRYDAPILGQVFTAPTGNLLSWSFYNDSQSTAGATFGVAAWNGTAGPNLFTAASNVVVADPANIGYYSHTISGINLALTAGQTYFAYFTTDNTPSPAADVSFEGASTSPLGGTAQFSTNTNSPTGAAYNSFTQSLVYSATFGAAVVAPIAASAAPEPATWAMMIVGFGVVGFGLRRRADQTVRVAYA